MTQRKMAQTEELNGQYVVFSKRDFAYEQSHNYEEAGIELYDKVKSFSAQNDAIAFGIDALPCLLLDKKGILQAQPDQEVILGIRPDGKYQHYDYGGGSDTVYSWDIYRVKKSDVIETLTKLSKERYNPEQYVIGLETQLL